MRQGVFILGMHRSGTSAATRLVNLLGPHAPRAKDLVPPSEKNPKGYWESMSLVAFNARVLAAVESDISCPVDFEPGWERDPRLGDLRRDAPRAFRWTFPKAPWVWKDPRTCLTLAFWLDALAVSPAVVLVDRNPLEIVRSSLRSGRGQDKVYALALWERYLRQALAQIEGLPVLVTSYERLLAEPLAWCEQTRAFLADTGVSVGACRESDVLAFVDIELRRARSSRADFLADPDVSDEQRELFLRLEQLRGSHDAFALRALPAETPTTETLLAERRRALREEQELRRLEELERRSRLWPRVAGSRSLAPLRRVYAALRSLRPVPPVEQPGVDEAAPPAVASEPLAP